MRTYRPHTWTLVGIATIPTTNHLDIPVPSQTQTEGEFKIVRNSENIATRRLELSAQIVDQAKLAFGRQRGIPAEEKGRVTFREVLDAAAECYLDRFEESIQTAGFVEGGDKKSARQRPVTKELWDRLEKIEVKYGVSRSKCVRCLLALMAAEVPPSRSRSEKTGKRR